MEKEVIDKLMDEGTQLCGLLDKNVIQRLLSRGLAYLEVPIHPEDCVYGKYRNLFIFYLFISSYS